MDIQAIVDSITNDAKKGYIMEAKREGITMKPALRKKAFNAVHNVLKPTYFDSIPFDKIVFELKKLGIVILQEDNTEWQGMLLGSNSGTTFTLGSMETSIKHQYYVTYTPYNNVMLVLNWYKDSKRKTRQIEVTGYIS